MINEKIEILNEIIKNHPQFQKKSFLYDDIMDALGCSLDKAKELATTHCNMISFYAILFSDGIYPDNYSQFFKWMLGKGYCNEKGYIRVEKEIILDKLGFQKKLIKYINVDDIINPVKLNTEKFYQVKIHGNTTGFHFMAGYIDDGVFKISDTSYRGIGVKASDHITEKNFCWIMEV